MLGRRQPAERTETIGGRTFTVRDEEDTTFKHGVSDSGNYYTTEFERTSTVIGPCPPLRVTVRGENKLDDRNDGAVAVGVPSFDDRFLVHCADIAFVRRVTPALTAEPTRFTGTLEMRDGWITLRPEGRGHARNSAAYLNALIPLLPPELRR
ncbi:hypothetical protein UK23_34285 [Lentzea aerocolonigenes]|uniref:Uncharacterized protein n=1 Tax=Lentzea aerocolonigenes TaxID=68170 RepID=A0A0F0GMK9_LENAE|nr:hypothetical protein [Lentzea aerocolonigenes]KJK43167.1 hypothetical protein UK23_34285 [Lentzea aerocolonigenes]